MTRKNFRCPKTGKWAYLEKESAEQALVEMERFVDYVGGEVYRCPFCRWFHVGRRRKPKSKKADAPKPKKIKSPPHKPSWMEQLTKSRYRRGR